MRRRITASDFLGQPPRYGLLVEALGMIFALCLIVGIGLLVAVLASEVYQ